MFLYILLVLILLALLRSVQYFHILCKNTAVAAVAQSKQHSETVLLLRGIKAVAEEIKDEGIPFDRDTRIAINSHTDAMEELAHQMNVAN